MEIKQGKYIIINTDNVFKDGWNVSNTYTDAIQLHIQKYFPTETVKEYFILNKLEGNHIIVFLN